MPLHPRFEQDQLVSCCATFFSPRDFSIRSAATESPWRKRTSGKSVSAIGAFENIVLGYFDWEKKKYTKIPIEEQVEVLSLIGDITLDEGKPNIHAHVVVGKRDGSTCGGHLLEARVRPTLEVILTESPDHLIRRLDRESGLALIWLEENP